MNEVKPVGVFIDGAYLMKSMREEFDSPKLDLNLLSFYLSRGSPLTQTYYYDCRFWLAHNPTDRDRARYDNQDRFFTAVTHLPGFTLRLGELHYRGTSIEGKPILIQKRVDVMLATDMVVQVLKGRIGEVVLLAGDADFIPAVEIVTDEGVPVRLYHGQLRSTDLCIACNESVRITDDLLIPCLKSSALD